MHSLHWLLQMLLRAALSCASSSLLRLRAVAVAAAV